MPKTKTETKGKTKEETKQKQAQNGKVATSKAKKTLKKTRDAVDNTETAYLEACRLLHEVRNNHYFRAEGYEKFADFGETLAVGASKAAYMADVWGMILEHGDVIDMDTVMKLGGTRARHLAAALKEPGENPQEWLDKAQELSCDALGAEVKVLKRSVGKGRTNGEDVITKLIFTVKETEANIVSDSLRVAKNMLDTTSDDEALAHVCMTFVEEFGGDEATSIRLKDVLAYVERTFNVKLSVESFEDEESRDEITSAAVPTEEEIEDFNEEEADEEDVEDDSEEEVEEEADKEDKKTISLAALLGKKS